MCVTFIKNLKVTYQKERKQNKKEVTKKCSIFLMLVLDIFTASKSRNQMFMCNIFVRDQIWISVLEPSMSLYLLKLAHMVNA